MGRASWKGSFVEKFALNKLNVKSNSNYFNIWSRRSIIPSNFISKKIFVYTGNRFKPVFITRDKIGFKFGEFCMTRNAQLEKKKGNKKKGKNKK
jgi:small subunit ribosomal protein S19